MYENSEADGNIDKAAVSVSPDGARRVVSPPSPAHVSFGHCWNEQIAESKSFIWAAGTDFGNVKEAMKDPWPNAHLQHDWLPACQRGRARRVGSPCCHRDSVQNFFFFPGQLKHKRMSKYNIPVLFWWFMCTCFLQFVKTGSTFSAQNSQLWVPPWWCDKLPPLARISSLAACCEEGEKTKQHSVYTLYNVIFWYLFWWVLAFQHVITF